MTWTVLNNQPIDKLEPKERSRNNSITLVLQGAASRLSSRELATHLASTNCPSYTWTVPNLWHVSGKMPGRNERKMVVAKRSDGDLVPFNAIALNPAGMAELESFGNPAYPVVPNGFHRQDAYIWKQHYPNLKVVAPRGAEKGVAKAVAVDLRCDELPSDAAITLTHRDGLANKEALMIVKHEMGQTLVACDALLNMPSGIVTFLFSFLLASLDRLSTLPFTKWMFVKDRATWQAQLGQLAATTTRVIPGHGAIIDSQAGQALVGAQTLLG